MQSHDPNDDDAAAAAPRSTTGAPLRRSRRARTKRGAPRFLQRTVPASASTPPVPATFEEADERFFDQESDSLTPTEVTVATGTEAETDESTLLDTSQPAWRDSPRRRAFMRWVGVVVAVSLAVCVVAFTRASHVAPVASAASFASPPPAARAPTEVPAPAASAAPAVPAAAAPSAPSVPTIETAAVVAPASPTADPRAARDARESARRALERGALERAREEGIRSIELDPSDAESWLVLGAAEMESGKHAEARATFTACTKIATKGNRGECAAMLR